MTMPGISFGQDQSAFSDFTFVGGVGYTRLEGNELVYDGAGNRISHLIWKTEAPTIGLGVNGTFGENWTVAGKAQFGFNGNSDMKDYDWLNGDFAFDNWSDRSIHPDTALDRYINLDIAVGKNFDVSEDAILNLHGGVKYTNVKWTAYGGSFIYSDLGFRDDVGDFPAGEKGITFEQRYPGLFIGGKATITRGDWTFTGLVRGGLTVGATDTDHHWMRNLRFEEKYGAIPFVILGAEGSYRVTERTQLTIGADFERFFRKKGSTQLYDISSGVAKGGALDDAAGMDFQSITLSAGLKVAF